MLRPLIVLGPFKVAAVAPAAKVLVESWTQLPVAERVPILVNAEPVLRVTLLQLRVLPDSTVKAPLFCSVIAPTVELVTRLEMSVTTLTVFSMPVVILLLLMVSVS